MNLDLDIRASFKRDFKLVEKQGWDLEAVRGVILQLQTCEILDASLKDHALIGDFKNFRECHIFADLVLIYQRDKTTLRLFRIGRHQELFKGY